MKRYVLAYVVTLVAFLGIDVLWLSVMGGRLYRPRLSHLLADQFSVPPAILFYLVYGAGIVLFAVAPALKSGQWTVAILHGAAFGFFAYATYDLTNQATLKGWPTLVTVADLGWGTVLTAGAATIGYLATASR